MSFHAIDIASLVTRMSLPQYVALEQAAKAGARVRLYRWYGSAVEKLYVFTRKVRVKSERQEVRGTLDRAGFYRVESKEFREAFTLEAYDGEEFKTPWRKAWAEARDDAAGHLVVTGWDEAGP